MEWNAEKGEEMGRSNDYEFSRDEGASIPTKIVVTSPPNFAESCGVSRAGANLPQSMNRELN